jgi:N-acetylglucosamine kinase-like BadF-type ATPase
MPPRLIVVADYAALSREAAERVAALIVIPAEHVVNLPGNAHDPEAAYRAYDTSGAPVVLGVDGGNTKTIALVAGLDGTIRGSGRAGRADIYAAASPEAAVAAVETAVAAALAAAGAARDALVAECFSLAGADWPEDFDYWRAALAQREHLASAVVVNDAIGALYAGVPAGPGVVVACGTGVATGARGADGRLWHSSWWQLAQGGHDLGQQAVRAVLQAELGILPATNLRARVLEFFHADTVEQVLHRMTARERDDHAPVEQLARALLDEALAGDAVAREIVARQGLALGDYALAAARRVGIAARPFTLALTGGVLRHPSPLLADAIVSRVRAGAPQVRVTGSPFESAVGALLLALETAGVDHTAGALQERLRASLPPAALFAT